MQSTTLRRGASRVFWPIAAFGATGLPASLFGAQCSGAALPGPTITRVWLTHRSADPSRIVVNWETSTPGDSRVRFGLTANYGEEVHVSGSSTLHHVEIPVLHKDAVYHYQVVTGTATSRDAKFKANPSRRLRAVVAADWLRKPDLSALVREDADLLLTAGDHVASLWERCGAGEKECTRPFGELVDRYPELFSSTPCLPVLGNHDREIRPRGSRPPAEPVYDVAATAFLKFFARPADGWKWKFDVPDLGVRFLALDLNHLADQGTTWQTCHPFTRGSEQFEWFRRVMEESRQPFVVTLFNEKSSTVRGLEGGEWGRMIGRGTLAVSGFGYFAERADVDGFPYFNTSLSGTGDRYPDPRSRFLAGEDNYLLLTFEQGKPVVAELKRLSDGKSLDRTEHLPRKLQ